MANSDAGGRGVRHVRCPRCNSVLQEPGVQVYQCGGCNATLRAKNRSGHKQDAASASPSRSGLPRQNRHLSSGDAASASRPSTPTPGARSSERQATGTTSQSSDLLGSAWRHGPSSDVASTSSLTPDAATSRRQGTTNMASRRGSGDLVSASKPVPGHAPATAEKELDHSTSRGAHDRDTDDAQRNALSPRVSGNSDAASELQVHTEERRTKHSGEAAVQQPPQARDRGEHAPKSAQEAAELKPSRDDSAADASGGKVSSPPPRHELEAEDLAPLREKILKTVDALKGDLSELFSKSPDLNPAKRSRPPRLPKREGHAASTLPARARHQAPAAVKRHGSAGAVRAVKHGQVAAAPPPLRGLPSRRYRRCRADPPRCDNLQPRLCGRHGFCRTHQCRRHHGKPECSSCRGHCARPRAPEPFAPRKPPAPAPKEEAKRRPPPRHHCRPVLKGAPFIICSTCFKLVQVPADFAVSTGTLRKLRCGSCSTVLSYTYRDPARKKAQEFSAQFSTDGSEVRGGKGYAQPDPFAPFLDDFGLSSYSTEDEQPLHVSRNTSFDTLDGVKRVGRLHRLMGYGSASELLRHSPDLYESFDERTTPDYDRKGKSVCIDAEDDDFDDSDDEDCAVLERSAVRGAVWPLPGMPGKGTPGAGAIRIKS